MCRNNCGYCTFVKNPESELANIMNPNEVLKVARRGEKDKCKEVLFSLGEKPELKYDIAKKKLLSLGAKSALIKGGHLNSKITYDVLVNKNSIFEFKNKKINTKHTHGTGCTLSSAIATYYSCGKSLKKSCESGIKYVNQAITYAPKYGKGYGPINHLNSINIKKIFR